MDDLELARLCGEHMWTRDKASRTFGIEIDIPRAGEAIAVMAVRDNMVNSFDVCHGGILVALADTAFAFACNARNEISVAASVQAEFLRPARRGDVLTAKSVEEHRGRKSGYYTVEIRNQDDELVTLFRGRSVATGRPLLPPTK
ncbi:MAG TPA: hydroxyphenylacetyl-CoA thioesterase PaaI [Woeseiaceae bacterium]|nr:hydroxyphenylacetyl-CoA thioesterase PaaI [Woeseiaceae bacterium]